MLTGSEKIRKYWKHYYSGAEGVIFMVDGTSNVVQLETARAAMQEALSDPQLSGLPILLLVTHQDKENCRSFIEVWLQLCVIQLIIDLIIIIKSMRHIHVKTPCCLWELVVCSKTRAGLFALL